MNLRDTQAEELHQAREEELALALSAEDVIWRSVRGDVFELTSPAGKRVLFGPFAVVGEASGAEFAFEALIAAGWRKT